MGLRSPQQLEQVRSTPSALPAAEAGKVATLDLATPVQGMLEQKAIGDQIKGIQTTVANRKDALVKITARHAIDSVTQDYKVRIANLKGDNALAEGQKLYEKAVKDLDELETKAPKGTESAFKSEKTSKILSLRELTLNTMNAEGQKAAVSKGESVSKMATMDAASTFRDIETFSANYARVFESALATEQMKGNGIEAGQAGYLNASFVASNSIFEGVRYSLSQVVTADQIDVIEKYYQGDITNTFGDLINAEDKRKINELFTKARSKSEDSTAQLLVNEALERGMDLSTAEKFFREKSENNNRLYTKTNSSFKIATEARNNDIKNRSRDKYAEVAEALDNNKPRQAEAIANQIEDPETRRKAQTYIGYRQGGKAKLYTDPDDMAQLNKLFRDNPKEAQKVNLNGYQLAPKDKAAYQEIQRALGKEDYNLNFQIQSGKAGPSVEKLTLDFARTKLGKKAGTNPKLKKQLLDSGTALFYSIVAENPGETNQEVLLGKFRKRLPEIIEATKEYNWMGSALSTLGISPESEFFYEEKVTPRASEEFPETPQTGRGAGESRFSDYMPTNAQIQDVIKTYKANGNDISPDEAIRVYRRMLDAKERNKSPK